MIISLLVAASENNVIGKNNKLPWYLPTDMKYFKNISWAMPVIMGRKTFESLGKPLDGRTNIVMTRNTGWKADGVSVVHGLDAGKKIAEEQDVKEIFIIGGAEVFKTSLPDANRVYLTRVHEKFEGDAFFPVLDNSWQMVKSHETQPDEKNAYALSFQVWERG
jgi:dihydrofolate reductase